MQIENHNLAGGKCGLLKKHVARRARYAHESEALPTACGM